jgi:hypothetical protein
MPKEKKPLQPDDVHANCVTIEEVRLPARVATTRMLRLASAG